MIIKSENSFIEFEFIESRNKNVSCDINVSRNNLSVKVEEIWFSCNGIESFLIKLVQLEKKRIGSAELIDMGNLSVNYSKSFKFKVYSTDTLGHMAVSISFTKTNLYSSEHLRTLVSFDIDPSLLVYIVKDFQKLLIVE